MRPRPVRGGAGGGLVASPQADLNAPGAERSSIVQESDRVGESVLGAAVPIAGGADRERVDDQAEGLPVIGGRRGRIGQGREGAGGRTGGEQVARRVIRMGHLFP